MVVYMDSLKQEKGADWVRVPFKGGGEATNAILSGSTPIGLLGLGNMISSIRAGKMTALALINNIRTPLLPAVPTSSDLAYKGAPSETWYGLFAPPGTPRPVIDKIAAEVTRVFRRQGFCRQVCDQPRPGAGDQHARAFAAQIKADRARRSKSEGLGNAGAVVGHANKGPARSSPRAGGDPAPRIRKLDTMQLSGANGSIEPAS